MTNPANPKNDSLPAPLMDYEEAFIAVQKRIGRTLSTAPTPVREYTAHLASSCGKCIRASSLLICAMDASGGISPDAVRFAAAVELLHLATLVHDDIIDQADTRRGIPTLQKKYGGRTAVICGDYLLAVALRMAANVAGRERFTNLPLPNYVGRICLGEMSQHVNAGNLSLSVYRYLRIIGGKTAALFEACFYAGATLTTHNARTLRRYARLGRTVGMIFQLTDDCNDFELEEASARKPVQSDYEQGVVTLPLIHALESDPSFKAEALQTRLPRKTVDEAVRRSGGLDYTRQLSKRYHNRALQLLEQLELPNIKRLRLETILNQAGCWIQ